MSRDLAACFIYIRYFKLLAFIFFVQDSTQRTSKPSCPPKWMAELENDDINLLQGTAEITLSNQIHETLLILYSKSNFYTTVLTLNASIVGEMSDSNTFRVHFWGILIILF